MKLTKAFSLGLLFTFLIPTGVMAQAFGEYGRVLGGATQGHGSVVTNPFGGQSQNGSGKSGSSGVGDLGGRRLPSRLVVSKETSLYPRQDDEAEKMARLSQGETLVPMVQSTGGNDWYMVKTQKGLIGWVKGSDVHAETGKKP
jgi:hypothetical protein